MGGSPGGNACPCRIKPCGRPCRMPSRKGAYPRIVPVDSQRVQAHNNAG